jgi:hypothetical protein
MEIHHNPQFKTEVIEEIYSDRDGVPVKYVCTTDLNRSDVPADVFFRETPHPEFGNRYFGVFINPMNNQTFITNADMVEDFDFGMVENDDGKLEYSVSHHDYKKFENGNMIDGGRQYTRGNGFSIYKIKDGQIIKGDE